MSISDHPSFDDVQKAISEGHLSELSKKIENREFSAELLPIFSQHLEQFQNDKEKVAPLIEKVLVYLPPNERGTPEVAALLKFLDSTTHFSSQLVRNNLLIDAAKLGNEKMVGTLLKMGAEINYASGEEGKTALHWACNLGKTEVVRLLLENQASIDVKSLNGKTPLHYACLNGNAENVKQLLEHNASVLLVNENGETPLHCAIKSDDDEIIDLLLNAPGIQIDAQSLIGMTPLHYACKYGKPGAIQRLLKHEASVQVTNEEGETPLHIAAQKGNLRALDLLLNTKGIAIEAKDSLGMTPFYQACLKGHKAAAEKLISKGATANTTNNNLSTPLISAITIGDMPMVHFLIDLPGIDLNAAGAKGMTPLHYASSNGDTEVVKLLLDHKASVDSKSLDGKTPLHLASAKGDPDMVQLLLDHKASVNSKTIEGETPLHLAVACGAPSTIELLIHTPRVDINAEDAKGMTPLHYASLMGNEKNVRLLLGNHAFIYSKSLDGKTALHFAIQSGNYPTIELLINAPGVDVNAEDAKGMTPLHYACLKGDEKIVQALLYRNASVHAESQDGKSSLHWAFLRGHGPTIDLLLNVPGVQIDKPDKSLLTPLHLACFQGNANGVEKLVNLGAAINRVSKMDRTPLHAAIQNGDRSVIDFLLNHHLIELNAQDQEGNTPLMVALLNEDVVTVRSLLEKGANPNLGDTAGNTPLYMSCWLANQKASAEIEALLIKYGANQDLNDEILERKILAHVMGMGGASDNNIHLEGLPPGISMRKLYEFFLKFSKENEKLRQLPQNGFQKICSAFEKAYHKEAFDSSHPPLSIQNKTQAILSSLNQNQPVAIGGGFTGHSIGILITTDPQTGNMIITLCNRGAGVQFEGGNKEVKAGVRFQISKDQLTPKLIESLLQNYSNVTEFVNMVKKELGPISKVELGFTKKMQEVGNCTWASSKTMLLELLIQYCGSEEIAQELYKEFSVFARGQALVDYKNRKNPYVSKAFYDKAVAKQKSKKSARKAIQSLSLKTLVECNTLQKLSVLMAHIENIQYRNKLFAIFCAHLDRFEKNEMMVAFARVLTLYMPPTPRFKDRKESLDAYVKRNEDVHLKEPKKKWWKPSGKID